MTKAIYQHISLTLRSLRRARGWSLDKTAAETGVSKAMLGQIEREESSPTIATLWKIASGFQTSFSSFLEEIEGYPDQRVQRSGRPKILHPADNKIRVKTLFPYDARLNCEIFLIELLPSCEHLSPPHKHGVTEHVIVVRGKMEILVNGRWQSVSQDEGLRFDASQPHGYRNLTTKTVSFHNMIHYEPAEND
ncbi:hypothetical protein AQUSIP_07900 [Aquicella siphonis]|uniref:HTH cro/C1-type domain-containing protein n=1 Tax=Aquicella siphonis TaxID=254247 RepID=A0A5E4PEU4_9COXI|nr:XRE family transcriptional regulator [Aquicella siphonis]VVC75500.1 hypothetical protein AQUSIP_07900 [Aquicella siphonis]